MTKKHVHRPDWTTLAAAGGVDATVDVWCECGWSGSAIVQEADIQWGDDEEETS